MAVGRLCQPKRSMQVLLVLVDDSAGSLVLVAFFAFSRRSRVAKNILNAAKRPRLPTGVAGQIEVNR